MGQLYQCIVCGQPVVKITPPGHGTRWIHTDGYYACRATYAAPNFDRSISALSETEDPGCVWCKGRPLNDHDCVHFQDITPEDVDSRWPKNAFPKDLDVLPATVIRDGTIVIVSDDEDLDMFRKEE